ncbi:MAG TPA: PQQ-dependent sugar dehydrogenase [Longimicrobiales bacterium]
MKRTRSFLYMAAVLSACSDDGTRPPDQVAGIEAVPVTAGLEAPVHLAAPPGDDRLFVVEQAGRVRIIENGTLLPTPFLDITANVSFGGERGLFSMAFDPDFASTGHFWVNYTDNAGDTRVERYRVSSDPAIADPTSAVLVLAVDQPYTNHNGGQLAFGPDGMLYIGMGDGGSGGDPQGHGQNASTLLGALLRIDVRSTLPYRIPPDNPYVGSTSARPEIWAIGLRNPWRFSFDAESGRLFIADVGQGDWEEVNAVPDDAAPLNYGWNIMEGPDCYNASSCGRNGLTLPIHAYPHPDGCSVTGGFVYRGELLAPLDGHYFYSDFCGGWLRSFRLAGGSATDHREWLVGDIGQVLSFGVDARGELYVLSANGSVYRLEPAP